MHKELHKIDLSELIDRDSFGVVNVALIISNFDMLVLILSLAAAKFSFNALAIEKCMRNTPRKVIVRGEVF